MIFSIWSLIWRIVRTNDNQPFEPINSGTFTNKYFSWPLLRELTCCRRISSTHSFHNFFTIYEKCRRVRGHCFLLSTGSWTSTLMFIQENCRWLQFFTSKGASGFSGLIKVSTGSRFEDVRIVWFTVIESRCRRVRGYTFLEERLIVNRTRFSNFCLMYRQVQGVCFRVYILWSRVLNFCLECFLESPII